MVPARHGFIAPYVDALFGLSYLYTETQIEDVEDSHEVASSTNFNDLTLSYGAGGGIMFKVYETPAVTLNPMKVYVDLKIRYMKGGKAEYLKEVSVRIEDGKVDYDVSESTTDLMLYQIGVAVSF